MLLIMTLKNYGEYAKAGDNERDNIDNDGYEIDNGDEEEHDYEECTGDKGARGRVVLSGTMQQAGRSRVRLPD
jgi:hypothetical protein